MGSCSKVETQNMDYKKDPVLLKTYNYILLYTFAFSIWICFLKGIPGTHMLVRIVQCLVNGGQRRLMSPHALPGGAMTCAHLELPGVPADQEGPYPMFTLTRS